MKHLQKIYELLKLQFNLYEKVVSPLEILIKFDERFKVASFPFFISFFNLLSGAFSIIKNIIALSSLFKFPVKLIFCNAFGPPSLLFFEIGII